MRRLLPVLGLVAVSCWSIAQAGEPVAAPKLKEVQAKPVLGTYGPVTVNYATGEIYRGKKQTRATVVYSNIDDSSDRGVGLVGTGLDPWGDDLVCVPGGGLLSTQSLSVFNSSAAGVVESCDMTVRFYDYDLNLVGSWSTTLDMIELIGEPLPPDWAVLIGFEGLEEANVRVPRFAVYEIEFSNVVGGATDIGQVTYYPTQVGWSAGTFYSLGDWWNYSGGQFPADLYHEIGVAATNPGDRLFHTTGGTQMVIFNGNPSFLGFISGYFDANLPQRWSAMPFVMPQDGTVELITAYWFTQDGAEADNVRYIVWRRTGLNRPVDGDQVATGVAGPFTFDGNGPRLWFRSYNVNIPLRAGDYYLTLYGDGGDVPNWLAWLTGGDKQDEALERANGFWRSRFFPNPGFEDYNAGGAVQCGPYMTDCDDIWNHCFALWGSGGSGDCSVEIVGCAPICVDETIVLNAVSRCPGGECQWSVSPADKVEIVSVDNCTITLRGIKPSDACDDVVVNVTYRAPDGSVWLDTCALTVVDVEEIEGPDLMYLDQEITLNTRGKPDGGECEWSAEYSGEGRVTLIPEGCRVRVQGTAASEPKDDITIKVKYKVCGKECQKQKKLTVAELKCTNIKFDHKGGDKDTADGLNIRKSFKDDLKHKGNGAGTGEWVKAPDPNNNNNEPALYVADKTVTCKVRFTIKPRQLTSARIKATKGGDLFANIKEQDVAFANGVSNPEFVEMSFDAATPKEIAKMAGSYEWTATKLENQPVQYKFDDSGPHTFYNVLDVPREPWYLAKLEAHHPWVSALDLTIEEAATKGRDDVSQATKTITEWVFEKKGLKYDTGGGKGRYAQPFPDPTDREVILAIIFNLDGFIASKEKTVSCYDCAAAVSTMSALVGAPSDFQYMQPFGYINKTDLIGHGACNNPFFDGTHEDLVRAACVIDGTPCKKGDACVTDCVWPQRTLFGNHAFVELGGKIFDACTGPYVGNETPRQYLDKSIDKSHCNEKPAAGDEENIQKGLSGRIMLTDFVLKEERW